MDLAVDPADARVIADWTAALRAHGHGPPGETMPVRAADSATRGASRLPDDVAVYVDAGAVIGPSARHCGLREVPPSLGDLGGLRSLDLTGNALESLPDSLARL